VAFLIVSNFLTNKYMGDIKNMTNLWCFLFYVCWFLYWSLYTN